MRTTDDRHFAALHTVPLPIVDTPGPMAVSNCEGAMRGIDIEDDDDPVHADRIRVQQALTSLVRNAVKALSGQAARRVGLGGRRLDCRRCAPGIEDNWPEVTPDRVDPISRQLISTRLAGTGFGLSVTRRIIEAHGSILDVDHGPPGGAALRFTLPGESAREAAA